MTLRQIYSELAKVLGRRVGPEGQETSFIRAQSIRRNDLRLIQGRLLLILEKIDYDRAHSDFSGAFARLRPARAPSLPRAEGLRVSIDDLAGTLFQGTVSVPTATAAEALRQGMRVETDPIEVIHLPNCTPDCVVCRTYQRPHPF